MSILPGSSSRAFVALALLFSFLVACSSASATATQEPTPKPTATPKPLETLQKTAMDFLHSVQGGNLDRSNDFLCLEKQDDLDSFAKEIADEKTRIGLDFEHLECHHHDGRYAELLQLKPGTWMECRIEGETVETTVSSRAETLVILFLITENAICDWELLSEVEWREWDTFEPT